MNYVDMLTRAVRLFSRQRSFWVLGIALALCGQSEYSFSANFNQSVRSTSTTPSGSGPALPEFLQGDRPAQILANLGPIIAGIFFVSIVLGLLFGLLGWFVQGALIQMIDVADQGGQPSYRDGFARSRTRLGTLFMMQILVALPGLIVAFLALAVFGPVFVTVFQSLLADDVPDLRALLPRLLGGLVCLIPLILLIALFQAVLRLVQRFAARFCVLEGSGLAESFRSGWQLMRHHLGYTALTWGLGVAISILFSVLAGLPALALLIPMSTNMLAGNFSGLTIALIAGLVIYSLFVGVVVGGILTSLNATVWSLLFRALRADQQLPAV